MDASGSAPALAMDKDSLDKNVARIVKAVGQLVDISKTLRGSQDFDKDALLQVVNRIKQELVSLSTVTREEPPELELVKTTRILAARVLKLISAKNENKEFVEDEAEVVKLLVSFKLSIRSYLEFAHKYIAALATAPKEILATIPSDAHNIHTTQNGFTTIVSWSVTSPPSVVYKQVPAPADSSPTIEQNVLTRRKSESGSNSTTALKSKPASSLASDGPLSPLPVGAKSAHTPSSPAPTTPFKPHTPPAHPGSPVKSNSTPISQSTPNVLKSATPNLTQIDSQTGADGQLSDLRRSHRSAPPSFPKSDPFPDDKFSASVGDSPSQVSVPKAPIKEPDTTSEKTSNNQIDPARPPNLRLKSSRVADKLAARKSSPRLRTPVQTDISPKSNQADSVATNRAKSVEDIDSSPKKAESVDSARPPETVRDWVQHSGVRARKRKTSERKGSPVTVKRDLGGLFSQRADGSSSNVADTGSKGSAESSTIEVTTTREPRRSGRAQVHNRLSSQAEEEFDAIMEMLKDI